MTDAQVFRVHDGIRRRPGHRSGSWLQRRELGGCDHRPSWVRHKNENAPVIPLSNRPPSIARRTTLEGALAEARSLLDLPEGWDGETAPRFEERTLIRVTQFLKRHAEWFLRVRGRTMRVPSVLPGPGDGSIDVLWSGKGFELLVNFSADPRKRATFYGDDKGGSSVVIKGEFDPSTFNGGLLTWLDKAT